MPCHTRMKTIFLQGVRWLCLLNFGLVLCVIDPGYLDFDNLPDTNFSCVGKVIGGYYADLETSCQMFHVCTIGQLDEPMDIRFLCLNGTVFDQETRVCERVDEVDCSKSERFYHLNLELYGNTAPPLLEEPGHTESPVISSSTSTTTPRPTTSRTTRGTFYTTSAPTIPPTTHSTPKVITSNQFPINSGPDIRFNPEEINIRLTPGSPPIIKNPSIIKSPSVSFQQQNFNGDTRITVTTHSTVYKDDKTSQKSVTTTQKPKSVVNYGLQHTSSKNYQQQPNYDYNYQNTENSDVDYHTDLPSGEYADLAYDGHMNFESTNQKKQQVFSASTKRVENKPFVSSTPYPSSPQQSYQKTDKPQNLQLSLPFPTLPPLTFSSPAPFTLSRHIETKRSNDNQRPRIIVSASASVSDASGRRLNYSLGTIQSHILGKPPHSYDEYKEGDEGLDPFYHDVPKVGGKSRQKRDTEEEENNAKEETSTEETEHTTHWVPPEYVDDNYEPFTYNKTENNITLEETTKTPENVQKPTEAEYDYYYEYVDDNYEPSIYDTENTTKETVSTITESNTELYSEPITQETTIESNTVTESMKQYHTDTTEASITTTEFQDYKITDTPEETTVNSEIYETTTNTPLTITETEQTNNYHLDSIPQESIESTTEITTISSESINEQIISTAPTTSENYIPTTQINYETTTPQIDTTTESIVTTINHETEMTTDNNLYTTKMLETTLNIESQKTDTTTEMNKETTTNIPTTTEYVRETTTQVSTTSTANRYQYLRTREPAYKRYSRTKPTSRHRFSSPSIHMSQSVLKLRGNKISNSTSPFTSSEEIASEVISSRLHKIIPELKLYSTTTLSYEEVPITDAPLSKSANPTEPKNTKSPSTTPITKTLFIPRRFSYDAMKSFNCFNKEMNKFYEDPRDCRLFHYCTPGYSTTQVLDMKFVCDYGTYFDSDKLICTKIKPQRCK